MSEIAIRVENLSKRYRIGRPHPPANRLESIAPFRRLASLLRRPQEDEILWALKDVSFEVRQGEVLGIIGRNGAGKSTLLKILSRITEPTSGRAVLNGRVGSLLEVGTGFNPELTGRENIYLSGAILGMKKAEIDRKFDEIVAFSEVEKFLDTPVKRYSSGMYVRLAFAVAAHLEAEIILLDEVLAVGDVAFQRKCLGKMENVSQVGRAILFVSHNLQAIGDLCTKAILLDEGRVILKDTPQKVIQQYLVSKSDIDTSLPNPKIKTSNFSIEHVACYGNDLRQSIRPLGICTIEVDIKPQLPTNDMSIHIDIHGEDHTKVLGYDSVDFGVVAEPEVGQNIRYELKILNAPLPPGNYSIDLYVKNYSKNIYDHFEHVIEFEVEQNPIYGNRLYDPKWHGKSVAQAIFTYRNV